MKEYRTPEIVLYNARLASGNIDTPLLLTADALAINQGRIVALGSSQDMLHLAGPTTEKIDLDGRLVVPGFFDSHIHFYEWALKRRDLQLDDLNSLDELLGRIDRTTQTLAPGEWIMGQGWNETEWSIPRQPSRQGLDRVAPNHPVLLWRCDLHLAVANSMALRLAGIDSSTPDPPEGRIERDEAGEPTGILRELAINLVRRAIAIPETGQVVDAFKDGMEALHRWGITGIHDTRLMADADGGRSFQCFQRLEQEKLLDLRCWMSLPGHQLDDIIGLGLRSGFGSDRLRIGHVKFFSDGGMGARTAWMIDPYLDADCGMPLMDMDLLAKEIKKADQAGLSVMVHAIGDRANREIINIYENVELQRRKTSTPLPPFRHRIEHVQMIRPEDMKRLGKLNLALNVTPVNMILDISLIDSVVAEKGKWAYAFRELIDTGSPVMFSSDCPVCSPDPLPAIHAAVTRQRFDGTPDGGWYPDSRISVAEALNAYTSVPAEVHNATDMGIIGPGKKADLAVLSQNILTGPPSTIAEAHVDMTVFDGRIVHRLF
ncbi:MAG: putative amidohydrolase YtcJ [Desulforhopalus sp.]|jgi:predicted amidohydrolase YtcJ